MDKISSVILFAVFGALIVLFWPLVLYKGTKKHKSKQVKKMSRNDYFTNQSNQMNQRSSSGIDESRPATIAVIYRSEMDYISRCIHDYPNIETGGQLFGFLREDGVTVVCYAIGPGRNANHQSAFFNQDPEYLQGIYNEISQRYGLRYIGEWHSHHQLGLAKPSGHDATTIVHGILRSNFRHFLLCIGNCDNHQHSTLNAFTFHLDDPYNYHHAPWKIIEMESPFRPIVDRELGEWLCHPRTQRASYGSNYILTASGTSSMITPNYKDEYWLNDKANNLVLKRIIDYLTNYDGTSMVKPMLDGQKHVHLTVQRRERSEQIVFGDNFPYEAPKIEVTGNVCVNNNADWQYEKDIFDSFVRYYDDFFKKKTMDLKAFRVNADGSKTEIDATADVTDEPVPVEIVPPQND